MPLDEVDFAIHLIVVICLAIFAILAVHQKNLMRAILCFAVTSAFLAILFFLLTSPFAAVLELTVGAGLIVVLFLVALTLSMGEENEIPDGGSV